MPQAHISAITQRQSQFLSGVQCLPAQSEGGAGICLWRLYHTKGRVFPSVSSPNHNFDVIERVLCARHYLKTLPGLYFNPHYKSMK